MKDMYKLHSYELPTVMKHGIGAINALAEELNKLSIQ